jgi:hypothetical protein
MDAVRHLDWEGITADEGQHEPVVQSEPFPPLLALGRALKPEHV